VSEFVAQRVLGIALGYEDLNDHDAVSSQFRFPRSFRSSRWRSDYFPNSY
jgi:hypothetical protein